MGIKHIGDGEHRLFIHKPFNYGALKAQFQMMSFIGSYIRELDCTKFQSSPRAVNILHPDK